MSDTKPRGLKAAIHPMPAQLWREIKRMQDKGQTGSVQVNFHGGRIVGWLVNYQAEHDSSLDVILDRSE